MKDVFDCFNTIPSVGKRGNIHAPCAILVAKTADKSILAFLIDPPIAKLQIILSFFLFFVLSCSNNVNFL